MIRIIDYRSQASSTIGFTISLFSSNVYNYDRDKQLYRIGKYQAKNTGYNYCCYHVMLECGKKIDKMKS